MIVVTFALPAESSAFIALLQNQARLRSAGFERITGTLHGQRICVMHTGVGEKSTRARLGHFLKEEMPTSLSARDLREHCAIRSRLAMFCSQRIFRRPRCWTRLRGVGASQLFVASLTTAHTVID